jgi:hypothetical protein
MSSYSRQQLEAWLKTIDVKADKVLDIGGSQLPIKDRTKTWDVKDYKILDLEQPHECKQRPDIICDLNEELNFRVGDKSGVGTYDIAFCMEVSEYWYNPFQALKNIQTFLKQQGILYISFHFLYPVHNPINQDYLRYTPQGAIVLLQKAGFEIESFEYRTLIEPGGVMGVYLSEGMKPIKPYNSEIHYHQGILIKAKKV